MQKILGNCFGDGLGTNKVMLHSQPTRSACSKTRADWRLYLSPKNDVARTAFSFPPAISQSPAFLKAQPCCRQDGSKTSFSHPIDSLLAQFMLAFSNFVLHSGHEFMQGSFNTT